MKKKKILIHAILTQFSLWGFTTNAAEENMKFHGTLVRAPHCHINNDQAIEVNFGNIGVNKVDGVNYVKNIDYSVHCDGESDENLYLSISGTGVDWNNAAIQSSADNLAIEILLGGKPFVLDSQIKVKLTTLPKLSAVPVTDVSKPLAEGAFTAGATLVAFYQ